MFKIFRLIPWLFIPWGRKERRKRWAQKDIKKATAYVQKRKKSIADLSRLEYRNFYHGSDTVDFFGSEIYIPKVLCGTVYMDSDGDVFFTGAQVYNRTRVVRDSWHIGRFSRKAITDKGYKWIDLVMQFEQMHGSVV